MYELLEQGNRAEELTFSVAQGSPDERVVDQMVALGLLRLLTGNYEEQIVQPTDKGLRALAQARARNVPFIQVVQEPQQFKIEQTNHGPTYNQMGNGNTMTFQQGQPASTADLLAQLQELRGLLHTLPEDERQDPQDAIEKAEKAVRDNKLEKILKYAPMLMTTGTQGMKFAEKVKTFLEGLGFK